MSYIELHWCRFGFWRYYVRSSIRLRTRGPMIGSSETDSGGLVLSKTFYGVTSNPPRYAPAYTKLAGIHFDILIPRCCAVWEPTSRCNKSC